MPHKYEIAAFVITRLLDGQQIRRTLHNTESADIARGVLTNPAHFGIGKILAAFTTANTFHSMIQRIRKPHSTRACALQQMKSHALGRFLTYARQTPERFDKFINQRAERHETSSDCGSEKR